MRISRLMVMGLLGATIALTGCKKDGSANLSEEVTNLRTQLDDRTKALDDCSQELRARDVKIAELQRGGAGNTGGGDKPEGGWSAGGGEMVSTLSSDAAFDSGKATLKAGAKKTLDGIAATLNSKYGSANVRVAGHTDADPIKKSGFKSNYHLAFERAWAVREYLISKGVASKRVSLASYGPDMPKGSKAASRRVEIIIVQGGSGGKVE